MFTFITFPFSNANFMEAFFLMMSVPVEDYNQTKFIIKKEILPKLGL